MKEPCGIATADPSSAMAFETTDVSSNSLHLLILDYRARRARLENLQTDRTLSTVFRRVCRLQAATLTMVINDLVAVTEGRRGRFG